ncbi:uncharacterized protein LOC135345566 [Halichondria panicea]|uniref:uncharacterized protein LOC135345566 n=1 Tax=Halichondria panicea TaxID=6063 RepID=UPI00312BB7FE
MSLDNEIIRRGYFNIVRNPRDGVLRPLNQMSSKRQWVVLRKAARGKPTSLELYKSEDQTQAPLRTIPLDRSGFKNIHRDEHKKAFILNLNDEVCLFQCTSRADMDDWSRDIETYGEPRSGGGGGVSVGGPAERRSLHATNSNGFDDFNGIPDDETFPVRLRKSNTIVFSGPCLLEVLKDFENNKFHIALFTKEEAPRLIVKWQIDHVRQYGSHQSAFKFESGRQSSTGVDWFILDTEAGSAVKIHRSVDYWAKHIVEQVSNLPGAPVHVGPSRAGTLPGSAIVSPQSTMKNSSSSVPRSGGVPPSPTSPGSVGGGGIYQPLGARDRADLYATPGLPEDKNKSLGKPSRPPKVSEPRAPPTASLPPGTRSLYQPLAPVPSTYNGGSLYEDLNKVTRDAPKNNDRFKVPSRPGQRDPTYMGLNPHTQVASEVYMGLDEARS